jgi:hypothetical protein
MSFTRQIHTGKRFISIVMIIFISAMVCHSAPYVMFKFDDLDTWSYSGFQWAIDFLKTNGAKSCAGIFAYSVEKGNQTYNDYVESLCNDTDNVEVWLHAYGGDTDPAEFQRSYAEQKATFETARNVMLDKYGYLIRTFSEHKGKVDSTTVQVFNDDPFFRTWVAPGPSGVRADAKLVRYVSLEATSANVKDYNTFVNDYNQNSDKPYLSLTGHPWGWDATDRDNFTQIFNFLKAEGCEFTTFWDYHKMVNGITDTTAPGLPTGALLTRINAQSIKLDWTASVDNESIVDGYLVFRDGNFIDITPDTTYTDDAGQTLSDNTQYQLCAINRANLKSSRTTPVSLSGMSDTTPPADIATVNDGTGVDQDYGTDLTQLSANWTASSDLESNISEYKYAIGTTAGGTDIVGWTSNSGTSVTKTGTYTVSQTYYFTVKAVNGMGFESNATNSDGLYIEDGGSILPPGNELDVRTYPNPYIPTEGSEMTFSVNSTAGGDVKIYTLSGKLVKQLQIQSGANSAGWDMQNGSGGDIVSGLYIYVLTDNAGSKKTGKIAITH